MFISRASAAYGASDGREGTPSTARSARAAVLHELVPFSTTRSSTASAQRRSKIALASHRAQARVGSALRRTKFKGHNRAAAFVRALAILFVGDKEFQGSQQKRPEPALFRVSAIEISPFQHPEEVLREILRLIGWITAPAQIRVQRIPVVLTAREERTELPSDVDRRRRLPGPPSSETGMIGMCAWSGRWSWSFLISTTGIRNRKPKVTAQRLQPAYSALALFRIGIPGSASFQSARKAS